MTQEPPTSDRPGPRLGARERLSGRSPGPQKLTFVVALVAGGLLLTACGSTERLAGDSPGPDETTSSAEESAPSPSGAPTAAEVARIDSLRILILGGRARGQIRVEGDEEEIAVRSGSETETVPAGRTLTLARSGDRVRVSGSPERVAGARVRLVPSSNGALRLRTGSIDRRYPGSVSVAPAPSGDGLRLVNRVELETYVASVVATEFPFDQLEGAKAQAVIARTYALRVQARNEDVSYDLTDDSASQAYRGLGTITELTRRAARATRGEILTYGDHPVEAVYSASAGGHTADNDVVWGSDPVPYLRGKEDPYDEKTPHRDWSFSIRADALHELLSEEYGFEVREVEFVDRGTSGRYAAVRLDGEESRTVSANALRLAVVSRFGPRSLKSTLFEVDRTASEYRFLGRGYGHGVGLSQWGARNRAEAGQSYEEILHFYYTDVRLERMPSSGEVAPPALAAAENSGGDGVGADGAGGASSGNPDVGSEIQAKNSSGTADQGEAIPGGSADIGEGGPPVEPDRSSRPRRPGW